MTEVHLINLTKTYDHAPTPAVRALSLALPSGRITALLGPSGCGKTTVLKIIAGLLHPEAGDVTFDGQSVLNVPAERRGAVMVFQNHLLFPYMSVGENIGFGLKMQGIDRRTISRRVAEMLALVQLPGYEQRRPRQLSGGQQQRVALARALIVQPRVLLLDEPLSNLDAHLRGEMRELIVAVQQQLGVTTVFVTHDQEEAITLSDHIALIFEGRLHQFGPPPNFYEHPASAAVARFFGGVNFVPGLKRGCHLETELGVFRGEGFCRLPDGPATLTIRPEALRLCAAGGPENRTPATVRQCLYLGDRARFKLRTAGPAAIDMEAVAPTAEMARFRQGQPVSLYLPPDKIWLIPAEGA
jgi:putative spermidine/putrescine transport system ATP-binding protein